jgi:hypothetical protein
MPDSNGPWRVVCEPEGNNPGILGKAKAAASMAVSGDEPENMGGMVIYLTNGTSKEEVSRVGWIRRATKNPKTSFEKQLSKEVEKATASADTLNNLAKTAGVLQ